MSDFVLALTTLPGDFDTAQLAQEIVGSGLAACVTILPGIRSVYTWQGRIQIEQEQQLFIKTTTAQVDPLWDLVSDRHPYDMPEFVIVPIVDGSEEYLKWVDQNVGPKGES
jgi:periplasmic divalent cation tolerance protein